MNSFIRFGSLLAIAVAARVADGHGTPILVSADSVLAANGGTPDGIGFSPMMFFESDDEGDPFATLTLPNVGPVIVWQLPGLEINGLNTMSSLSIEVLARPMNNILPVQSRSLWYWNPTTSEVTPTTAPLYLLGTGQRFATIDPASNSPPEPFLLVDQVGGTQAQGGQQGFHNHGLLSYAVDNSPLAAAGAYSFFARLVSNEYASSEPFLVVFNNGVEYEAMADAALAINAAAFLPGDFNHDDRVDAADYVTWRDASGNAEEYLLWRGGFGATYAAGTGASMVNTTIAPEPTGFMLAGLAMMAVVAIRRGQMPR